MNAYALVEAFLDAIAAERGAAKNTIEAYRRDLSAYVDFLRGNARRGDLGETIAGMTPCMRLYAFLGASLDVQTAGPYAEWVQTYARPDFEALAGQLEQLLDEQNYDSPAVHQTYRRAMGLELGFFDAAIAR